MPTVQFRALEYCSDQSFAAADYAFEGDTEHGYVVKRGGDAHLELGPGYRLLRSDLCGVCSTDLDRHCLPFALPQITGHEVVLSDESGRRYVSEINASHQARGIQTNCPYCCGGLDTHCASRVVLGIHDLPGGFGPWVLAPVNAILPVPDLVPTSAAVLLEPFAAALHAVHTVNPRARESIAVLGPRRLGLLVIAALSAVRKSQGTNYRIVALSRHARLLKLAALFGADAGVLVEGEGSGLAPASIDRVIDTTGQPSGLELALRLAKREVHLKSTHGRPAAGLTHLTEMVVDELSIAALENEAISDGARVAWLVNASPPAALTARTRMTIDPHELAPSRLLEMLERQAGPTELPRFNCAVVDSAQKLDLVTRPSQQHERALIRPRGTVLVHPDAARDSAVAIQAVVHRGLRLSTSRCGDFRPALALLAGAEELRQLGEKLVTHRFRADELSRAFEVARSPECIKAVVEQAHARGA